MVALIKKLPTVMLYKSQLRLLSLFLSFKENITSRHIKNTVRYRYNSLCTKKITTDVIPSPNYCYRGHN